MNLGCYNPTAKVNTCQSEGTVCDSRTVTATVWRSNPKRSHWETGKAGAGDETESGYFTLIDRFRLKRRASENSRQFSLCCTGVFISLFVLRDTLRGCFFSRSAAFLRMPNEKNTHYKKETKE